MPTKQNNYPLSVIRYWLSDFIKIWSGITQQNIQAKRKISTYSLSFTVYSLLFVAYFLLPTVQGQGIGRSPYSALGVGEKFIGGFATSQSMGNSGVSVANGIYLNNLNPALVAFNRNTVFEVGALSQYKQLEEGSKNEKTFGANLNYIALGFPSGKNWSMAIQLKPYTYVDYETRAVLPIANTLNFAKYTYRGTGGLNKVAWTNALTLGKSVFVGLESAYVFGAIDRESLSQLQLVDGQDYTIQLLSRTNHGGFVFKPGIAWRQKLKNKIFFGAGATYELQSNLNAKRIGTYTYFSGETQLTTIPSDTVSKDTQSKVTLPAGYRIGISLDRPLKWQISADFAYQAWSQYRNFSRATERLQDSYSFHLGGEYTPNFDPTSGFFKQVQYRAGYQFVRTPYLTAEGSAINDNSFSLGFALPIRNLSYINLGFVAGQRNGTIKERYGRVVVGFTLSDLWFKKYKLD